MINIKLGNKEFNVDVADTSEKKEKGLMDIKELPKNQGMLFIWDTPQHVDMWMHNTLIPLDIIFINEDQEVIDVKQGQPNDDTLLGCDDTSYVVELNINSGVQVGDNLEFDEDNNTDIVMQVLAPDGQSQMDLSGGERIVSRKETKILIRKAKKAKESDSESDYKALGKYMFKVLKGQDNRKPDYVKAPTNNSEKN